MNSEIERAIESAEARLKNAEYLLSVSHGSDETISKKRNKVEVCRVTLDALREQAERQNNPGEVSDGYHTFNELYHHRAVLFSVICNANHEKAWKSKLHHDGTMYNGMFIVGIETPNGQATYHYDTDPYWGMFRVAELPKAPEWDGHTPKQAIERIAGLDKQAARLDPKPLSWEDLKERNGKPIWTVSLKDGEKNRWEICTFGAYEPTLYDVTWLAYDHQPKEEQP